jgi:pimeloyl-ACP methyl ester carboxylesterase
VKDWYPYFNSLDSVARARIQSSFDDQMTIRREHIQQFREEIHGARVVPVVGARHYLFLSDPRQIADGMRAFLASLE